MHAFDHARAHRDAYRRLKLQTDEESERWQQLMKETKERHRQELKRLYGDAAAMHTGQPDRFSYPNEPVMEQQHPVSMRAGFEDPAQGAEVFATTDAFGSEAEVKETEIAGDVASGIVEAGEAGADEGPAATVDGSSAQPDETSAPPDIEAGADEGPAATVDGSSARRDLSPPDIEAGENEGPAATVDGSVQQPEHQPAEPLAAPAVEAGADEGAATAAGSTQQPDEPSAPPDVTAGVDESAATTADRSAQPPGDSSAPTGMDSTE